MTAPKAIGLVGGLGPGATIAYYRRLTRGLAARPIPAPLLMSNADNRVTRRLMGAGAIEELADYLAEHVGRLERAGAQFAAIGALAPHMCAAHLPQRIRLPLLDPIDCLRRALAARRVRRLCLFGARFVMESSLYGRLEGWDVVRLPAEATDFVHDHYVRLATAGAVEGSGADIEGLKALARAVVQAEGAELVVLAGTDFSVAFDEADCGFPALDCTRVHVDAILARAYAERSNHDGRS